MRLFPHATTPRVRLYLGVGDLLADLREDVALGLTAQPGAIRTTLRNRDRPVRRRLFSGLRCARDL